MRMVADQIQVGKPLPFGVRDDQGQLLLAKGRVVANDSQLQTLLTRGLYTLAPDQYLQGLSDYSRVFSPSSKISAEQVAKVYEAYESLKKQERALALDQ